MKTSAIERFSKKSEFKFKLDQQVNLKHCHSSHVTFTNWIFCFRIACCSKFSCEHGDC